MYINRLQKRFKKYIKNFILQKVTTKYRKLVITDKLADYVSFCLVSYNSNQSPTRSSEQT